MLRIRADDAADHAENPGKVGLTEHSRRCANVVALLADYLERQLPPDVHSDLERHLAKCSRCIAQLKTYESTVSLLRSVSEEDLPPELRSTLKAFIDRNCQN
jgi:anti-sigma factor (TIGR02949 family)